MNISKKGLDLIKSFEGYANEAYLDTGGVATIGYGTIRYPNGKRVQMGDTCTLEEAEEYLRNDVQDAVDRINKLEWKIPLNQNQFDALVSFQYNTGSLPTSSLYKEARVNPKDPHIYGYDPAKPIDSCQFLRWVRDDGHVIKGLIRRRIKEADLYAADILGEPILT